MIDLVRPRLTLSTMMLLVAIGATFFAVFAFSGNFPKVRSPSDGIVATLAWGLATALPALWVGPRGSRRACRVVFACVAHARCRTTHMGGGG